LYLLIFTGQKHEVDVQEKRIYSIASKFSGMPGGDSNGERGYILTFVIAYIRDIALDYNIVAESFETSVPWSHTFNLCENVKLRVVNECRGEYIKKELIYRLTKLVLTNMYFLLFTVRGIRHHFITCRVTQTYDVGACVYFYFAFNYQALFKDPVQLFEEIENAARDEILANRGSISHHHGIGKIRAKWLPHTISSPAIGALLHIKRAVDPDNIFGNGNMLSSPETMAQAPTIMHSKL
jgi:alkyldihydroxyacetonephosphate synthase